MTTGELAAWRGLLRVHSALVRELDAELRSRHDLSLHEYEVLLVLAQTPDKRMRMSDLAAAVLLSQSGLTRLVDRLADAGSVERTRCEDDRRGLNAELPSAGRAQLEGAAQAISQTSGRASSIASTMELGYRRLLGTRPAGATAE